MDSIDVKVFGLITAGVVFAVAVLKRAIPSWVEGKEEFLALVLPVAFTVVAKLLGAFKATDWIDALAWAIGAALAAGIAHDKLINPVVKYRAERAADEAAK